MRSKKYIQLPKGYLSYSQITLWQSNPGQYKKIYFDNREELKTGNISMEYGKVVANALEHGIQTDNLLTDSAILLLPKYDLADQEFEAEFKTKYGWLKILIKPDTMDSKTFAFREYKTGKYPWTQEKADNHLQLKIYATGIYIKHKILPPSIYLDWIETEDFNGEIRPTGKLISFPVTLSKMDIVKTISLVTNVAKDIATAYALHEPDKRLEF